ncbi:MAG TPA: serine/threonine-protein kinase [Ktedonobacteraceae bacterium]|jgi:serine/threonine protein kinase
MALAGQQLGHYHLVRLIGRGGMGEVYLAEDTRISRQVAVKVVQTEHEFFPNAEMVEQKEELFQREMKAISRLDHPSILSFYDFGKEATINGSTIYMVMPYRSEGSLTDWLLQHSFDLLPPQDIGHMIIQAASALQHAHDHNIIHRDVKPSNFLVRSNPDHPTRPDLFLVDFGLARFISASSLGSNSIRGTYSCMAPEQWAGEAFPATDQYALAIMAYLLLTGQLPFQGQLEHVMFQHLTASPKPPSELNSSLSSAIDEVIQRALAKKSDARFPTVTAFAIALQQALDYADQHITLAISQADVQQWGNRAVTLPDGRQVTVTIPLDAQHEQVLDLPNQGAPYYEGGPHGPLLLTLCIDQDEAMPSSGNDKSASVSSTALALLSSSEATSLVSQTDSRNKPSKRHTIPLIALALVLIVSSVLAAVLVNNTIVTSNNHRTATALSITHTNATRTSIAQTAIQANNATATAITANLNLDPYQSLSTLALTDPLSQPQAWKELSNTSWGGQCQFANGTYQISQSQLHENFICSEDTSQYSNFAAEVKMMINQGDCGGLTIRGNSDHTTMYFFRVCQNGSYSFAKYVSNSASNAIMLKSGSSAVIKQGTGQLNVIAIVANGSNFDLYVNHQKIDSASDSTYSRGGIGLFADAPDNATMVTYQDVRVWTIG